MATALPIPTPGESIVAWAIRNPEAVTQALTLLQQLQAISVEIVPAGGNNSGKQSLVMSDNNIILPIPLKLSAPIADSTATAASASAQLNLLLAALRRTRQLPT